MSKNNKTEQKNAIIFILAVVLAYTWFIQIPQIRENHKEACKDYIEGKNIDKSVTVNDYFDGANSSDLSEGDEGWIR